MCVGLGQSSEILCRVKEWSIQVSIRWSLVSVLRVCWIWWILPTFVSCLHWEVFRKAFCWFFHHFFRVLLLPCHGFSSGTRPLATDLSSSLMPRVSLSILRWGKPCCQIFFDQEALFKPQVPSCLGLLENSPSYLNTVTGKSCRLLLLSAQKHTIPEAMSQHTADYLPE